MSHEEAYQELLHHIQRWNRRFRWIFAVEWFPRGLLTALFGAAIIVILARFNPLFTNLEVARITIGLVVAGSLFVLIGMMVRNKAILDRARLADRHFRLAERISTAVEIHNGALITTEILAEQQLIDALKTAVEVDVNNALPLRFDARNLLMISLFTVLLSLAVIVPNPQDSKLLAQRAIDQTIQEQLQAIQEIEIQVMEDSSLEQEQQDELLKSLQNAYNELQASSVNQEQAVAVLSESEAELRDLADSTSIDVLERVFEESGQALLDDPLGSMLGQALQSSDFSEASGLLNQIADQLLAATDRELESLAEALAETGAALREVAPELAANFSDAAENLRQGRIQEASQYLRHGAANLQDVAQEQALANRAADAADQLSQGRQLVTQAGQSQQETQGTEEGEGLAGSSETQFEGGSGSDNSPGSDTNHSITGDTGGTRGGGANAESVFVPGFVDLRNTEGIDFELPVECGTDIQNCGGLLSESISEVRDEESLVPYSQVFGEYRQTAYRALEDPYIPLELRDYIRDYFISLEP